jgi:probable phosphoglycerate mutase
MRVLLLRHGQTDDNIRGICQGQRPVRLNATGQQQARELAAALAAEEAISQIVASDLPRARETAEIIAARLGVGVAFDARLRERSLGEREGTHVGVEGIWATALTTQTPKGGESLTAFRQRVRDAMESLPGLYPNDARIAVVGHGGPLRSILEMLRDGEMKLAAGAAAPAVVNLVNCSIIELEGTLEGGAAQWSVIRVNDVRHLQERRVV